MIKATFIREMQILLKDRGGLFATFLLPVIFIAVFGFAFSGEPKDKTKARKPTVKLALCAAKGNPKVDGVVQQIKKFGFFNITEHENAGDVERAVAKKQARIGLIIPADFHPRQERPATVVIDDALQQFERAALLGPLESSFNGWFWPSVLPALARGEMKAPNFYKRVTPPGIKRAVKRGSAFQVVVPGNAVLFAFFAAMIVALSFHEERKSGTWQRLLAAPGARWRIIIGKLLPVAFTSFLQMSVLFLIGSYVFGMHMGGSLMAWLVVTVAVVLASTSLGLLIASLGGSDKQISSYSTLVVLVMGMVGGCMMPRMVMPQWLQQVGLFVPHGWALDAYYDVIMREGTGIMDVMPQILALLAFSAAFSLVGIWRFRFEH